MSSYLKFYIVPKEEGSKPLELICYSRNSYVYQYFNEVVNPVYIGIGDETHYTELTVKNVDDVLEDMKNDINKYQNKISEYQKHADGNSEIIEYILEMKEEIDFLEWALHKVEFIRDLVYEASCDWNEFNKILCNVD